MQLKQIFCKYKLNDILDLSHCLKNYKLKKENPDLKETQEIIIFVELNFFILIKIL